MGKKKPEPEPKRRGAPYKLRHSSARKKFLAELRRSGSIESAAAICDVSRTTAFAEIAADEEFKRQVRIAESRAKRKIESKLFQAALEAGDVQALKFILERKWWRQWGRRDPESIKPSDALKWANNLAKTIAERLSADQQTIPYIVLAEMLDQLGSGKRGAA